MRLDQLSIALRRRDPWEAMDLGVALWRRHFGAILRPWFGLTLPVFVLFNAAAWALDLLWLAALLLWWLKPWFDRVPVYVLSRAVFGTVPGMWQVLRARELYAPGLPAWLSWRRLDPARSLLLPVDLLEGESGARRGARTSVLRRAVGSQSLGLMLACACFEAAIAASLLTVGLMFVPVEFLSESARAVWFTLFESPPKWAQLLANAVYWLSVSAIEPIYVSAGFGLYLNRRTQLEAWDVELVFRRLAARAQAASSSMLGVAAIALLAAGLALPGAALAKVDPTPVITPAEFVGDAASPPDPAMARAFDRAYADPSLARTKTVKRWQLRKPNDPEKRSADPAWLKAVVWVFAAVGEYGLWLLVALLVAYLLWKLPAWLPWVRVQLRTEPEVLELTEQSPAREMPLPDDVPAEVTALWDAGRHRDALALLYRASVARVAEALGTPFPPGATEADCLRRSRRLDSEAVRGTFAAVVRTWQRAAYARQFPDADAFAALLAGWRQHFPVSA